MDPTVINAIVGVFGTAVGLVLKHFLDGWQEARGKRKDEAQKQAVKADRLRSYARRLVEALHATRALALKNGIPMGDLPDFPERED